MQIFRSFFMTMQSKEDRLIAVRLKKQTIETHSVSTLTSLRNLEVLQVVFLDSSLLTNVKQLCLI